MRVAGGAWERGRGRGRGRNLDTCITIDRFVVAIHAAIIAVVVPAVSFRAASQLAVLVYDKRGLGAGHCV